VYVGHLGVALGARGVSRQAPLWLLVLAAQSCDWVDAFVGCGLASRIGDPAWVSHSVPAVAAIALLFAAVTAALTRSRAATALVAATAVSHILLDYVTGQKPTWPGGPVVGLDLYSRPAWDFALLAGLALWRRSIPASTRARALTALLAALLLAAQAASDVRMARAPESRKCV
jgi:hypothetical protein